MPRLVGRGCPAGLRLLLLVLLAVLVAVAVKSLLAQAFYIPSSSMRPGLVKNDRILVEKPSYWGGGAPQRGDVVVFADPGGWLTAEEDSTPTDPVTRALAAVGLYPGGVTWSRGSSGWPATPSPAATARAGSRSTAAR